MNVISNLPHLRVPNAPFEAGLDLAEWDWDGVPALPPLLRADGSGPAAQQTQVRACADAYTLYVRFDCEDRDIWATYARRDDPIYDEEVVEVMISPGPATPARYYEFELSPAGVLFDALIHNPNSRRADMTVETAWDCRGLRWLAVRDDAARRWWATLAIPWAALAAQGTHTTWRVNFYRIERPRDAEPEYSCWSPTMTEPADFHKPAYFGFLSIDSIHLSNTL
jgi:hypothetical protein